MAQVKGLISNFFQLVVPLVAPSPPKPRKLLELLLFGRLGRNKAGPGLGGTVLYFPPREKSAHLPVGILRGRDQFQEVTLTLQVNIPGQTPLGSGVAKSLTLQPLFCPASQGLPPLRSGDRSFSFL